MVEWLFAAIVVVAISMVVVSWRVKRQTRSHGLALQDVTTPDSYRSSAPTRQVPSRLSATEALSRVQVLRNGNAQWDEILRDLNPTGESEVQRLLIEIRGPHMFVPHVGLGVIEDGCRRALALSPKADALAALREATRSQDPFVRY
jgi:hypothetical protein